MDNIVTITIQSTHFYLVDCAQDKLMIDAGWFGKLSAIKSSLKANKIALAEIRFIMLTHNHVDHAGLVQDVKQLTGARLVIHEVQIPYLKELADFARRKGEHYMPISSAKDDIVVATPNRERLHALGIPGEIIESPGHSPDSVSIVTDSGAAFTGDLHLPMMVDDASHPKVLESWQLLLAHNARVIYPGHGAPFQLDPAVIQ